jgi:hypothetical protein
MKPSTILLLAASLLICGCGRPAKQEQLAAREPALNNVSAPKRAAPAAQSAPLSEPNGPIDPKTAEAAGQVVQSFGALTEQNRWSEANALWSDLAAAAKFHASLANVADLHLEIGNPGEPEGAAGSVYVTIPAIFYGDLKNGEEFRRSANVILRRVNDVPGSTEAQRRWHIERIDWAA